MKYLRFEIDVRTLGRKLEEEHRLPAGQWGKPRLDKNVLTLTFGSEEIRHPFTFAMTLQEWKEHQAEQDRKAESKRAAEQEAEAKRNQQAEEKRKARKSARGVRHHAEETETNPGDVAGD